MSAPQTTAFSILAYAASTGAPIWAFPLGAALSPKRIRNGSWHDCSKSENRFGQEYLDRARAILARLAQGEASVNELVGPFDMTLPAISKHIKVLEQAGLIGRSQRAQYRPCTLNPGPLEEVSAWAEQCRAVWEARFDRMDDYLAKLRPQRKAGDHDD